MVAPLLTSIESAISHERLESYRPLGGDDLTMIVTYLHNTALCEALYPSLSFLEIALRNSLHLNLSALHGSPSWYSLPGVLERHDADEVARVTRRIAKQGKAVTSDRVVSELNFGFWVALLSTPYDARFWRSHKARYLKASFPHVPRNMRQRTIIYRRYNELRSFRNRVFHHETIWNRSTLTRDFGRIYEAIEWINPEMAFASRLLDRFPDVSTNGYAMIEKILKRSLQVA